jgi:hypothetical protein
VEWQSATTLLCFHRKKKNLCSPVVVRSFSHCRRKSKRIRQDLTVSSPSCTFRLPYAASCLLVNCTEINGDVFNNKPPLTNLASLWFGQPCRRSSLEVLRFI